MQSINCDTCRNVAHYSDNHYRCVVDDFDDWMPYKVVVVDWTFPSQLPAAVAADDVLCLEDSQNCVEE